jgi:hypothetical protein
VAQFEPRHLLATNESNSEFKNWVVELETMKGSRESLAHLGTESPG